LEYVVLVQPAHADSVNPSVPAATSASQFDPWPRPQLVWSAHAERSLPVLNLSSLALHVSHEMSVSAEGVLSLPWPAPQVPQVAHAAPPWENVVPVQGLHELSVEAEPAAHSLPSPQDAAFTSVQAPHAAPPVE